MDIADLQLLEAVAAEGSFSRAAGRMRFSQPSVSVRIAAVERAVGTELFVRDSRGARLTAAGEHYLGYVRRCLMLLDQGKAAAARHAAQRLRVGMPASYAPALGPALADAALAHELALSVRADHSGVLRERLLDGILDLVFASPVSPAPGIISRPAAESPVVALSGRTAGGPVMAGPVAAAPVAAGSAAAAATAPITRFAVHSWSEQADDVIAEMLAADAPGSRITMVSPAATAIALALRRGYVAIVPRITAAAEIKAGWLEPAPVPLPAVTARIDYLYPARHPHRDLLDAIGSATARAVSS